MELHKATDPLTGRFVKSLTEEERKLHRRRAVARYNHRRRSGQTKALTQREWQLWHKYGLSLADIEALMSKQGGACAICRQQFSAIEFKHPRQTYTWNVDHDHKTGRVRGLLCFNCNVGLGKFHDSTEVLVYAIQYLDGVS